MDTFNQIKEICNNLLPILGVIALTVVIILIIELINTLKNANKFLNKTKGTVDLVDESIKKVQAPLDSVVKVSHTVDVAHDATIKGISEAKEFISKNAENIKEKISDLTNKETKEKEDEIEAPNPEDIIGG